MKKLLLVPGFSCEAKDYNLTLDNFEIIFLKKYSDLNINLLNSCDLVLAHSLGCLQLAEFINQNNLSQEMKDKIYLYSPIIESNLFKIIKKAIFYRIKALSNPYLNRHFLKSFKNFLISPVYTLKNFLEIINTSLDYKLNLYKKYSNIYLSKIDVYSGEYFDLLKCHDIRGNHDEIFFDKDIINIILEIKK